MARAVLAADGTIKLPSSILKVLGLKPGDRLDLLPFDDGQVLMIAKNQSVSSLKGILAKPDLK
jgi:bifunctional DNA-binding transcriptional regulator/antitoxin component of YhaV-PrlF toxin-antitoxin module